MCRTGAAHQREHVAAVTREGVVASDAADERSVFNRRNRVSDSRRKVIDRGHANGDQGGGYIAIRIGDRVAEAVRPVVVGAWRVRERAVGGEHDAAMCRTGAAHQREHVAAITGESVVRRDGTDERRVFDRRYGIGDCSRDIVDRSDSDGHQGRGHIAVGVSE